ncbi:MAG: DUF456 family protein [Hormoscilla sp. GUM202]|nr:DUF456 family protein [Hormoscilla sp. GUM202]
MSTVVIYWLLVVVMLAGIIGSFVPSLPGGILILAAIAIWGMLNGLSTVTWALGFTFIVVLLNIVTDVVATYVGAKQAGASKWGQIGATIGLVLGILGLLPALPFGGPLVGMLVGPLLGAFVCEFLYRKNLEFGPRVQLAFRAGIGKVVGSLVGNLIQGLLALSAVVIFLLTTWPPGAGT